LFRFRAPCRIRRTLSKVAALPTVVANALNHLPNFVKNAFPQNSRRKLQTRNILRTAILNLLDEDVCF